MIVKRINRKRINPLRGFINLFFYQRHGFPKVLQQTLNGGANKRALCETFEVYVAYAKCNLEGYNVITCNLYHIAKFFFRSSDNSKRTYERLIK